MAKNEHGVWVAIAPDASARIARWNNKQFRDYIFEHSQPYLADTEFEQEEEDIQDILIDATARHILLDIRGQWLEVRDGKIVSMEFTVENIKELFRALPEFYDTIVNVSQELNHARDNYIESTAQRLVEYVRWGVRWGDRIEQLEALAASGIDVPALNSRPDLSDHETILMDHFNNLMSVLSVPFPFTEVEAYCRLHGMDGFDERQELVTCMMRMGDMLTKEKAQVSEERQRVTKEQSSKQPESNVRQGLG